MTEQTYLRRGRRKSGAWIGGSRNRNWRRRRQGNARRTVNNEKRYKLTVDAQSDDKLHVIHTGGI